MKTLITNTQVVELAFDGSEYISPQSITTADITAATARFIAPIVGERLLAALEQNRYPTLLDEFVLPALAMGVRVLVQPSLNVRLTTTGLTAPSSPTTSAATDTVSKELFRSLVVRLRQLYRRLSDHLNANALQYEEYDAEANPLNRYDIYGGVVQIR